MNESRSDRYTQAVLDWALDNVDNIPAWIRENLFDTVCENKGIPEASRRFAARRQA